MTHLIQITSELAPIAKVGGLGDVVYGLSKELMRRDCTVEILLPKYDCIPYRLLEGMKVEEENLIVPWGETSFSNTIWSAEFEGLKLFLVESHHPAQFFNRNTIYGCPDDQERFAYFSRVCLDWIASLKVQPDLLHVHDWPTAFVPILLREQFSALHQMSTLLTIHNLEHQGKSSPSLLSALGLNVEKILTPQGVQDPSQSNQANTLKGGIVYADAVNTVSPNYQREILTTEKSCGLLDTLLKHQGKLSGILNGIDEHFWDPAQDPHLIHRYPTHHVTTEAQMDALYTGKKGNRRHLQALFSMPSSDIPLIGIVTRLVPQKAPYLIKAALYRTLEKGGQFILLGTTQDPEIQREFNALRDDLKDNPNAVLIFENDESLAHQIFAASDMFLIPSLFEPCGLTQLIALRYGTVPIARVTGGLADTVFDWETAAKPIAERNGFTFDHPDPAGVYWALDRAMRICREDRKTWRTLIKQGIGMDFSWKHAASDYLSLYFKLTQMRKGN